MPGAARSVAGALGGGAMSTRSQDPAAVPLAGSSGTQQRRFAGRSTERSASPDGAGNKGSDNEDVDEEPEVRNFKYWANRIGHVFKKVRQTKKRRKSSYGSLFSSLGKRIAYPRAPAFCTHSVRGIITRIEYLFHKSFLG